MLPSLQRLSLAVSAPDRAATTGMVSEDDAESRPDPARAGPYVAPPELRDSHGNKMHPLTQELMTNTYTLMPFYNAFHPPPPRPAEQRFIGKNGYDMFVAKIEGRRSAASTILAVRRWVKIGGKNGMDPEDVAYMLGGSPSTDIMEVMEPFQNDPTVGYVFDGDNFEPDKAPFSVTISELIKGNHTVVAIKTAEPRMVNGSMEKASVSEAFYEGWERLARKHPETFVMAMMPEHIKKETVTKKADAFVFWGSTYVSKKTGRNYRFKPDHTPTQGWKEIQEFKQDESLVCREVGEGDNTFVAVKKDF